LLASTSGKKCFNFYYLINNTVIEHFSRQKSVLTDLIDLFCLFVFVERTIEEFLLFIFKADWLDRFLGNSDKGKASTKAKCFLKAKFK